MLGKNGVDAQTITLESIDPGPYGRGSSIAVQFTLKGVFPVASDFRFILELSDVNGSFNSPVEIGSYPWHYTTFVNGIIPSTANPSANYKVRVRAMRGTTELAAAVSATNISVVTTAGQSGKFIGITNWGPLDYNNSADFWMIGVCAGGQASMTIKNNISKLLPCGTFTKGFVRTVREDGKLDIQFEPLTFEKFDQASEYLLECLKAETILYLHDRSHPDEIREKLGMSKKLFKQAVGKLYRLKKITLGEDCIRLV